MDYSSSVRASFGTATKVQLQYVYKITAVTYEDVLSRPTLAAAAAAAGCLVCTVVT